MQFLNLLEEILEFIPKEYNDVANVLAMILPYIHAFFLLATCFFGEKLHQIWYRFIFFIIGFLLGFFVFYFIPFRINFEVSIALGIVVGVFCSYNSTKLHHLELFVVNAFLTFSLAPDILNRIFNTDINIVFSLLLAIIIGFVAMKYKYIVTIITTSISGAFAFIPWLFTYVQWTQTLPIFICSSLLTALGMFVQFHQKRKSKLKTPKDDNVVVDIV